MREVFARQLMQVSGVSGEKAAALVERYSTPSRWASLPTGVTSASAGAGGEGQPECISYGQMNGSKQAAAT